MKKTVAILLLLGMLIPMGLISPVSGATVEKSPFYFVNTMDDVIDYDNIYPTVKFYQSYNKETGTLTISWDGNKDIESLAASVKEEFDGRPEGTRIIDLSLLIYEMVEPDCMIYLEEGVALYAEWIEEFFKVYKAIGGKLDSVEADVEYTGVISYYIHKAYRGAATATDEDGRTVTLPADTEIYNKIVAHPLYATEVRPLLEERGFHFTTPIGNKAEIFNISEYGSLDADIWDAVMHNRMCDYINEAFAPLFKYYPDVIVSNYVFSSSKGWQESVNARGEPNLGGNLNYAGNAANQNFYVRRPSHQFHDDSDVFKTPVRYNGAVYADTVFNSFLYEVNTFKEMYESTDTEYMTAWISGFNYAHDNRPTNSTRITPYYAEAIFHIGLMNVLMRGYIVGPRDTDLEGEPYDYEDNMKVISDLMNELTRMVGYADRKAIAVPMTWNSAFVLSGMYAGGRNVWRLTPNTGDGTTLESFKVAGDDPTFYINGQTITFPQGKIVSDGNIDIIGTCGYWIETPADVTPVVTNEADRYSKYPAFGEDFDSYASGMEYTYNNVKIPGTWQVSKGVNGSGIVQEDQTGNKVLAVTGNFVMKSAKLAKNITAGDSYAVNQTWEVTVTIPADLGAEAKAVMLAIYDDEGALLDGGFQIADGKLYYADTGKYVAFEGLDISTGGKFTLKRNMSFSAPKAITCDYVVCDSAGKELIAAKAIPVAKKVKAPVSTIGFNFSKLTGTIYLDDYKLHATGTAADFKLYDAKTGMPVEDISVARDKATAYRLSWMNTTAKEQVYSVVAAIYSGDKLVEEKVIKEVKMAPDSDAVETGIVEVEAGQSACVYLRNDTGNQTDDGSDHTENPSGSQSKPGGTVNTNKSGKRVVLIGIVAGEFILVDVILTVIIMRKKKKKIASNAKEVEDKPTE